MSQYLLPSGLRDLLPPEARHQTFIINSLLQRFELFGYGQVITPLAEFEDTLIAGKGTALEKQTFRTMDPISKKMLAIRSDITMQVARIVATRVQNTPLPMRLSYAGNVLRVEAEKLSTDRQITQAGIELVGSDNSDADIEVISVLLEALAQLGVTKLVVDIGLAGLLDALLATEATVNADDVMKAVSQKDASSLPEMACKELVTTLMQCSGDARTVIGTLVAMPGLPESATGMIRELQRMVEALPEVDGVSYTIDPLEGNNFKYHQGVCFSIFHTETQKEIGRGGRYSIDTEQGSMPATGATLFVNPLLESVQMQAPERVLVARGSSLAETLALREQGMVTLQALADGALSDMAKQLGCSHVYENGTLTKTD